MRFDENAEGMMPVSRTGATGKALIETENNQDFLWEDPEEEESEEYSIQELVRMIRDLPEGTMLRMNIAEDSHGER